MERYPLIIEDLIGNEISSIRPAMNINEEIKRHEPLIKSILKKMGISINDMDYEDYLQELRIALWESLKERM